jgi:hypothetical protein
VEIKATAWDDLKEAVEGGDTYGLATTGRELLKHTDPRSLAEVQQEVERLAHADRVKNQSGPRPTPIPVDPHKARRRAQRDARKRNRG